VSVLADIRAIGTFREPPFADLAVEHVPFDELTDARNVEQPLFDAVVAGSSAAVVGVRGGGKSSVLAWLCRKLPDDRIPIRVPIVGMEDPSDPAVLGGVALGAALEAARVGNVDLDGRQTTAVERSRADDVTAHHGRPKLGGKLGGGPVPAEISAELGSLEAEYSRATQPVDRLYGFDRLLGIFTYHGLTPVFVLEDTEAALGAGADEAARDAFFTKSLRMLVREVDAPTVVAVQEHFVRLASYGEVRPFVLEVSVPLLEDRAEEALRAILERRLAPYDLASGVEEVLALEALPELAGFYAECHGSIRQVLAALDVACAAALDSGHERLELSHVRLGIEDFRVQ
jgi:hypothetical protein